MRSVFLGTPDIAVPALRALATISTVVGVVCQPDRPRGRGLKVSEPAVKRAAHELGLEVHQPVKVKTGNLDEWLRAREVDVGLVMAYGRILPAAVLAAPRVGCMNLHASLLPKYRGAAPIQWALMHGEVVTGISLMQMDEGVDTGPVYARRSLSIGTDENAGQLSTRLSNLAAVMVENDVPRAVAGDLHAEPQDEAQATHAPPLTDERLWLDLTRSAREVINCVRGLAPRPGARVLVRGHLLRVLAVLSTQEPACAPPGSVHIVERRILVATGDGTVELSRAQQEGKRELMAQDLINGRVVREGDRFERPIVNDGR